MAIMQTFICGSFWPQKDGCELGYVVSHRLKPDDGGGRVLIVLVELFDEPLGRHVHRVRIASIATAKDGEGRSRCVRGSQQLAHIKASRGTDLRVLATRLSPQQWELRAYNFNCTWLEWISVAML